jgi:hypothetical protein
VQQALIEHLLDAVEVERGGEEVRERRVVEQRARRAARAESEGGPAERERREPAAARRRDAGPVGAIDLVGAQIRPEVGETGRAEREVIGVTCDGGGVDRARLGAADHRERHRAAQRIGLRGEFRERTQRAGLVSRACSAAHHHER